MITPKDLEIPHAYQSFLKDIKTSFRPAEMIVYEWSGLPSNVRSRFLKIIQKYNHRVCHHHDTYPKTTKCIQFRHMKDANRAMDQMEELDINADISYY